MNKYYKLFDSMKDKDIVNIYVDGALGIVDGALSFANPGIGIAAIAITPAISMKLKEWFGNLVEKGSITHREYDRLEKGIDGMKNTLDENAKNKTIRKDDLLRKKDDGFCAADDIFESLVSLKII